MSREEHAREGAQSVIPDDEILDVAVVMPRGSTFASVLGSVAGVEAGGALGNTTAWGVTGGLLGQRANSARRGSYPSIVLAVSATRLYVLGRTTTALVGGWKNLHPVAHIDRSQLSVRRHHRGTVAVIELTDDSTGVTLEFEAMNFGGLGLKDLLGPLEEAGDDRR
ncbi:hypothetical protein [Curtobacterium sp. PhB115]|uniref:hypothetical protein n=1 Tax=Curtobacterium sp. PhB115 TaxID=2485173 RepID=UPI000FAB013D|nr:hypothetical protein [Curtobacterium sp. PhB115]ROP74065.1 hypothetical protein EDF19_0139 [Curtobacterium sp. PhB115]